MRIDPITSEPLSIDPATPTHSQVLHTIGGDDTNMAAANLAEFLAKENYSLTVIGLPKTIDNGIATMLTILTLHTIPPMPTTPPMLSMLSMLMILPTLSRRPT